MMTKLIHTFWCSTIFIYILFKKVVYIYLFTRLANKQILLTIIRYIRNICRICSTYLLKLHLFQFVFKCSFFFLGLTWASIIFINMILIFFIRVNILISCHVTDNLLFLLINITATHFFTHRWALASGRLTRFSFLDICVHICWPFVKYLYLYIDPKQSVCSS